AHAGDLGSERRLVVVLGFRERKVVVARQRRVVEVRGADRRRVGKFVREVVAGTLASRRCRSRRGGRVARLASGAVDPVGLAIVVADAVAMPSSVAALADPEDLAERARGFTARDLDPRSLRERLARIGQLRRRNRRLGAEMLLVDPVGLSVVSADAVARALSVSALADPEDLAAHSLSLSAADDADAIAFRELGAHDGP